mgnify:CR=1 FL=1
MQINESRAASNLNLEADTRFLFPFATDRDSSDCWLHKKLIVQFRFHYII